MTSPRTFLTLLATMVLTISGAVVSVAPAEALAGTKLIGHRCRTYPPAVTNENTVAALVNTAGVAGAWCEVDAWTIADGTVIIWHDSTWGRVANHATLPSGVEPSSLVADTTWAQVAQIRTKGGRPVARLERDDQPFRATRRAVARQHQEQPRLAVNLGHAGERGWCSRAVLPPRKDPGCRTTVLDQMRSAGARIGLKLDRTTPCLSPEEIAGQGHVIRRTCHP